MKPSCKRIPDGSFYEKAISMLFAAGVTISGVDGAVIYQTGLNADSFNLSTSGGGMINAGAALQIQFASDASGFVNGIGTLTLPSGALQQIFRGSEAPSIGQGVDPFGASELSFYDGMPTNSAEDSADNYFAFTFTSGDVNGGNPVYGWARFTLDLSVESGYFTEWAYQDDGSSLDVGVIPEPSGLALLALGAVGVAAFRRRRRQEAA